MQVAILCSATQKNILDNKNIPASIQLHYCLDDKAMFEQSVADIYMDLLYHGTIHPKNRFTQPYLINAVHLTNADLPTNSIRFNGWNTFLEKEIFEVATSNTPNGQIDELFKKLNWQYKLVPDIVGLVSPRVVSMIINEAYWGLEQQISSKTDIDIAMKLGTNYPFGPFEWSKKIGLKHISNLLQILEKTDERYQPCPLLIQEATNS